MWSVVMTHTGAEHRALEHIERQDFPCFLPRFSKIEVVRGRRVEKVRALFPGYLFVEAIGRAWHSLLGTRGVIKVILSGEEPATVQCGFVERLMVACSNGVMVLQPPPRFNRGDRIRVEGSRHALFGHVGIYDGMNQTGRLRVLFAMLGRYVPVELDETEVAAA
jgi:transcriptional antiterminator RfaH